MRPNKTTVDNSTTSALIGGLEAYTNYVVQISAFTAAGEGNITHINVSTQEGGKSLIDFLTDKFKKIFQAKKCSASMNGNFKNLAIKGISHGGLTSVLEQFTEV